TCGDPAGVGKVALRITVKPREGNHESWRWILLAGAQGFRIQSMAAIGGWRVPAGGINSNVWPFLA
ncbi:hypothetical protein, partial [Thiolapillus sp.]|uniref:hypothetical protein n=1 Tax=Thiolapillus sp. TaxID=2017437 RepID=UPI003AF86E7F